MHYLNELNPAQREAAEHKEGPLLILAGAGAGKTKTVTHRILHLIRQGVPPEQILAITFTNKAANEMKERVRKLIEEDQTIDHPGMRGTLPFVSTFHSLGVFILKHESELLGLPRRFTIYDKNDSKRAIKTAIESAGLDTKQWEPGRIQNAISREKGNCMTAVEYEAQAGNDYFPTIVSDVWIRYERILKKENALDFDDLLLKTLLLLKYHPDVRAKYQSMWNYVHIDEYQDTNKVQYSISKLLTETHKNICVVGDIDQMIYSWRGADITNILNFEKDYPEAKTVLLEENYRSTNVILSAANEIIQKNKNRREKNLFTKKEGGERISVFGSYDEAEEASFIAGRAMELIRSGVPAKEISVLYRANFQSRVLEEALLTKGVPYQVLGTRFFERKEVKDMLSYVRAAVNPTSTADISRISNVPTRGIGKVTLLKMLEGKDEELTAGARRKVQEFRSILSHIAEKAHKDRPTEVLKYTLQISGLEKALMDEGSEGEERLENIRELVTLARKYDGMTDGEGIEKLLEDAALASDQDTLEKHQDAVKLMTIHAAKGLEFDYVFITGLEDGLFPHRKLNEKGDVDEEEERRLFYVALTRARKKLFLTFAGTRMIFGSKQVNIPSEFVTDIREDLLQAEEYTGEHGKTIYFD